MQKTPSLWIYLEILFAVSVWGGTFVATKIALLEVSPATVVWIRFSIGALILGAVVLLRKQWQLPKPAEWGYFFLLGFIGITFHQWLQATGLMTAQATTTAWIVATTPIFMAILGWLVLKERMTWLTVAGIALATLGVALVISKGDWGALMLGSAITPGDWLVLVSAPNWAIFSILSRRGLNQHPATRLMFFVMLTGWVLNTLWLFGGGTGLSELPQLTNTGWIAIAILGVFGSGLAYIAWYDALQSLPAAQVGAFLYIEPLVAMLVGGFLLAEVSTFASILGGVVIIAGVSIVNLQKSAN
jgi:drug/metabolite transporter (DMT)-like permease